MNLLDLTLESAAENLALDEALAAQCDAGGPEVLRFWEPRAPFVVVGYANQLSTEVDLAACAADGVPVLRRASGGGTVLQMPGCLDYALILRTPETSPLATVTGANRFIMERCAQALAPAVGQAVAVQGHTDLAIAGRKIAGNAQRRYRHCLLFHGCLLLEARLELISRYLRFPSKQPDYRQDRPHAEFVTNLGLTADMVKAALQKAWGAESSTTTVPLRETQALVAEKYGRPEWNEKFR